MLGGVGLYLQRRFFGISLATRVPEGRRREPAGLPHADMKPFKPYRDLPVTMQYYAVPVDVPRARSNLSQWAQKALAARASAPGPDLVADPVPVSHT